MNNIENTYTNYDELLEFFEEGLIQSRFEQILREMQSFLHTIKYQDKANVNEVILMHAILDYFSDVLRLKSYQKIKHINEIKIKAYETFWLIQRKPIQLLCPAPEDDSMIYLNEKFVLSRLISYLLDDQYTKPLLDRNQKPFKNFVDTLYYYLKFRRVDPQTIELMILAYKAGQLV